MMSKQNVPELRFPEFSGEWEEVKFDEIFSERSDKTSNLAKYPLYSLTVEDGITPKSARYNREFLVKKEGNFKLVDQGNIVYNPMNVTLGAIDISRYPFTISVSGYYYVMTVSDNYSTYFMKNYLKINKMINHYKKIATGSLIEKQRVHFSEFKKIKKPLPGIEEQNKIGEFLSKLDRLIELEEKKLELLEEQKKGYMQKIFSQELRFKDENGDDYPQWKERKLDEIANFSKGKGISKNDLTHQGKPCVLYGELYTKYKDVINKVHSKTDLPSHSLKIAYKNSVLIPSSGETPIDIAKATAVNVKSVLVGGDINILEPINNYLGSFISMNINAKYKNELSKFAQGKTVVHLYNNEIKNLRVDFPTFKEQKKITLCLEKFDQLIEVRNTKIEQLKIRKKAFIQKMFS